MASGFFKLRNRIQSFTIVELIVVIVVIGLIATISIFSYSSILGTVRNSQRASSTKVLAEYLEKYYEKNGEYPGCSIIANPDALTVAASLGDIDPKILTAPLASAGLNSVFCNDIDSLNGDVIAYYADQTASCQTGTFCFAFELKYREELTGSVKVIKSKHGYKTFATKFGSLDGGEEGNSVIQSSDGGYVIVGAAFGDAFITKTTSNGSFLWSKSLGGGANDTVALDVIQSNDGGYIVIGYTSSFGSGEDDILIAKYTSSGLLSWAKVLGGIYDDRAYSIIPTLDGNYFIVGSTNGHAPSGYAYYTDGFVAKINTSGSVIWSKTVVDASVMTDAIQISDESFISVGYSEYDDYSYIIKLSSTGTQVWSKTLTIPNADNNRASSIVLALDNNYVIAGNVNGESVTDPDSAFIAKVSTDGSLTWLKTYSEIDVNPSVSLARTYNGDYVITGRVGNKYYDVIIIRTDSDGDLIWSKVFGKSGPDQAMSIIQSNDGGFAVAGSYYNYVDDYENGYDDVLIAKFKPNGTMNNCTSPVCGDYSITVDSPTYTSNSVTVTIDPLSFTESSPAFINSIPSFLIRKIISL